MDQSMKTTVCEYTRTNAVQLSPELKFENCSNASSCRSLSCKSYDTYLK